jgi:hypothetical protein
MIRRIARKPPGGPHLKAALKGVGGVSVHPHNDGSPVPFSVRLPYGYVVVAEIRMADSIHGDEFEFN